MSSGNASPPSRRSAPRSPTAPQTSCPEIHAQRADHRARSRPHLRRGAWDHPPAASQRAGSISGCRKPWKTGEHLARASSRRSHCELKLIGDLDDLGETINITVYRLIQECLTNVVRHAEATAPRSRCDATAACSSVSVSDNGKGLGERNESESRALRPDGHARARAGVGRRVSS